MSASLNPKRARWSQLNKLQQRILMGHVGPGWLPQWFCNSFADLFDEYYDMKTQAHHDFGYLVGGDEAFRKICDDKLLVQLRQDIKKLPEAKKPMGEYVADVMYLTVRIFGRLSFKKRDKQLNYWGMVRHLNKLKCELRSGKWYIWKHFALLLTLTPLIAFFTSNYVIFKTKPAISKRRAHYIPVFLALFLPQMAAATCYLIKAIRQLF